MTIIRKNMSHQRGKEIEDLCRSISESNGSSGTAKRVILKEKEALEEVISTLDWGKVSEAIAHVLSCDLVYTTGVGKCSYIAQKFSATLCSLGKPSHYIHPVEASHGDLGAIDPGDCRRWTMLFAFSHSGESRELSDILWFTKRLDIPTVCITSGVKSLVDDLSATSIIIPKFEGEGWEHIAPSISSTAMLAISDAIAIAQADFAGFGIDEFKCRHPGGILGKLPRDS